MRGTLQLLIVIAAICPSGAMARGIVALSRQLQEADGYRANVRYEVTMPAFSEPVVYDVTVNQVAAPGDSLAPCGYLIDWVLPTPTGESRGWSAYSEGHHYRYRDHRLQEYHLEWDGAPMGVRQGQGVDRGRAVQCNAQFADLLPGFIASQLSDMASDSTYRYVYHPDSIVGGVRCQVVEAVRSCRGYDAREWTLVADYSSGMPLRIEIENNPGEISEQTVTATYTRLPDCVPPLTDEALIERYPEEFGNYRESYFKVENLAGRPLPAFSARRADGERYTRENTGALSRPTVVVILDSRKGDPAKVVGAVREGVGELPMATDVVWAFVSSDAEEALAITGAPCDGEVVLLSCRGLARDCGVSEPPVIILAGRDGVVSSVIIGANNDTAQSVIQKMMVSN